VILYWDTEKRASKCCD